MPKQSNRQEENKEIRANRLLDGWSESPKRFQQKDLDARWVKKHDINHYGYKNSIYTDAEHGFIKRFVVTPANIHYYKMLTMLLDPENQDD